MENLSQFRPEVNSQRWLDTSDLPNEVWHDIQGFEGTYQISCYGRIKSLPRTKRGGSFVYPNRIIKLYLGKAPKNNYYFVVLQKDGVKSSKRVCRLVASAFIDNPSNLPQVNHIDENTHNDTAWNLEWCTASYNNSYGEHPKKISKAASKRARTGKCIDGSNYQGNMVTPILQYDLDGVLYGWNNPNWISVKDALPPENGKTQQSINVWATDGLTSGEFRYNFDTKTWTDMWGDPFDITHWMPCPQLPREEVNSDNKYKVYAITHRGFEFDDIGYPDLAPIKFFSTKEKRDNAFKELVTKQIEWFENCKNSKYSNPDNYEIGENTNDDFLELYMDKWCYEWGKIEFELEE